VQPLNEGVEEPVTRSALVRTQCAQFGNSAQDTSVHTTGMAVKTVIDSHWRSGYFQQEAVKPSQLKDFLWLRRSSHLKIMHVA